MKKSKVKRKLLTGAVVGTLAGISVMMFDKSVRNTLLDKSKQFRKKTIQFVSGVKQDPRAFMNNVKDGFNQVSKSFKEISQELQQILSQIEEVRMTSHKIIETAKDAGEDLKEMGSNLVNINGQSAGDEHDRKREDLFKLH